MTAHEPHGHCRLCHGGTHRYRGDNGRLGRWVHVNRPDRQHRPDVVVTCCDEHRPPSPKHRPDGSARWADRCVCGAQIVFFEGRRGSTTYTPPGYGCEALGWPTRAFEYDTN